MATCEGCKKGGCACSMSVLPTKIRRNPIGNNWVAVTGVKSEQAGMPPARLPKTTGRKR